ncbi:MAG: DEAD/DEAH box helicase [Candidatus Aenigmarchaeota archaeon]|nr:DEAD/DEAH box helicase [Candidatus Aenigmarchaeota archaeon]
MVFYKLNEKIREGLKKLDFNSPTLPQQLGIPKILTGNNVLIIAPTGLGKTEAVMLPIFSMWLETKPKPTSIIYITPLKSLNRDLLKRFNFWSKEIEINISVRHGDTSSYERKKQAEFPDDMLVVTPETLQAILPAKKMRENLKNVKWVIVDEVHELAESKRGTQLALALQRLKLLCKNFQIVMLSATIAEPEKVAKFFAGENVEIVRSEFAKKISISVVSPKAEEEDRKISEIIGSDMRVSARLREISRLVNEHNSTIIFTNTRDFAEILTSRLKHAFPDLKIENHHSSLSKNVRIRVEEDFKNQKLKAIVATSSLELGIDIGSVDFIIHYMSPRQPSRALQRIGRSGHHFSETSTGIIIVTDIDDCFESAIIAKHALTNKLQKIKMHVNSLDVLAHQIIGLLRDNYRMRFDEVFSIVRKSSPYKHLKKETFLSVCMLLSDLRYLFIDGDKMKISKRGLLYYLNNLSTIPDSKNYDVINVLTNEKVGTLDEEFVAVNAEEGMNFIIKGEPWRIVSIDRREIFVEPSGNIEASVPAWEGELMPVSFEVAQDVGVLRGEIETWINHGYKKKEIIQMLMKNYPIDKNSAIRMVNIIKKQMNFVVPTDKRIVIEKEGETVIMNSCFGNQVNDTLGRFFSYFLSLHFGSVSFKTDPYRIIFEMPEKGKEVLNDILYKTSPQLLEETIDASIVNTKLFQWKFLHVARRFGVISREVDFGKISFSKIIEVYKDSPVWKETLNEIKTEKLDLENAKKILELIQKKEIKVIFINRLSPLGKAGLRLKSEIFGPQKADVQILSIFKQRLLKKKVKLVCMNCGKWSMTLQIKDIPEEIRCHNCRAKLIAVCNPNFLEAERIVSKHIHNKEMTIEEKKMFEKMSKVSELVIVYGKKAIIALSARGVGPKTALRILRNIYFTEDDFIKAIFEAEKNFIRTKKFWK